MTGMDRETRVPRSADCPWSMGDHQLPFSGPWTWRRQAYPFQFLHVLMFLLTLMAVPSGFFRAWERIFLLDGAQLGAFAHMSHVPLTDFTHVSTGKANSFLFLSVPVILKSTCRIDVRWFPFDVQKCELKFGSWSYGRWTLDLQMTEADISSYNLVESGIW